MGRGVTTGSIHFDNGNVNVQALDVLNEFVETRVLFNKGNLPFRPEIQIEKRDDIIFEEYMNTEKTIKSNIRYNEVDRDEYVKEALIISSIIFAITITGIVLFKTMLDSAERKAEIKFGAKGIKKGSFIVSVILLIIFILALLFARYILFKIVTNTDQKRAKANIETSEKA